METSASFEARSAPSSYPTSSQSCFCPSLHKAAQNRRIRAGLCQRKGPGESASCDGRSYPSRFLSVERRAGSPYADLVPGCVFSPQLVSAPCPSPWPARRWDVAGHAYASAHDSNFAAVHEYTGLFYQMFYAIGPEADARRTRALPLIAQDPARIPDGIVSGPQIPLGEVVMRRFFGED